MNDRGQSTVELALAVPLLCLFITGVVQVAVVVRDDLAVQSAAREAVRAAAVSAEPTVAATSAATRAVSLAPLTVAVAQHDGIVTATVRYVEHTDVPLIGMFVPDVVVTASVSMAAEPP